MNVLVIAGDLEKMGKLASSQKDGKDHLVSSNYGDSAERRIVKSILLVTEQSGICQQRLRRVSNKRSLNLKFSL